MVVGWGSSVPLKRVQQATHFHSLMRLSQPPDANFLMKLGFCPDGWSMRLPGTTAGAQLTALQPICKEGPR